MTSMRISTRAVVEIAKEASWLWSRNSFVRPERLRHHSLQAGRLLHVKVPLEPSIEVLAVYQHAWRSDANNAAKEALLAKRLACWQRIQCFAEATGCQVSASHTGRF